MKPSDHFDTLQPAHARTVDDAASRAHDVLAKGMALARMRLVPDLRVALRHLAAPIGFRLVRVGPDVYDQDGLRSVHDHSFMHDPGFLRAYERGVAAAGRDYGWHWRVHVGLWVATCASRIHGHFVECGVNRGFMASAVMRHLDWDSLGKTFYLMDTFSGPDERFLSEPERRGGAIDRTRRWQRSGFYASGVDSVRANFAEWRNVRIIVGAIPETLGQVDASALAFLHLDMNCASPERSAAEHFWDRLSPGAFVLMDDYAYAGSHAQKVALDDFARGRGVTVLSLPTGQGLLVKPF